MIVSLKEFEASINKVKSLAVDPKTIPGIIIDSDRTETKICYCDTKRALIDTIDSYTPDGEEELGKVIVLFNQISEVINSCKASGSIMVDNITINKSEGNRLKIECDKYFLERTGNIITGEDGEEEEEVVKNVCGHICKEIVYSEPDKELKHRILTRVNYDDILSEADCDVWDKLELTKMLSKLNKEDGKTVYVSSSMNGGFVVNQRFVSWIANDTVDSHGFTVQSKSARSLCDIFNKTDTETISVSVVDGRYCKMVSENRRTGVWFEIEPGRQQEAAQLMMYKEIKFENYNLVVVREMLADAIRNALSDKEAMTDISFSIDENSNVIINIIGGKSNASKASNYTVGTRQATGNDITSIESLSFEASLNMLSDIVDICDGFYVMVDIAVDERGKFIRVSDTNGRDETGKPIVTSESYALLVKA